MNKEFRRLSLQKIAEKAGISDTETVGSKGENVKGELTLAKILKDAGRLTDFVESKLEEPSGPTDFKSKFLKLKPGPEREKLVFSEIKKRGKSVLGKLVPITVPGPAGTKITYEVMPDYLTIDGLRVPMSGQTAQRVANYFGMSLPTSKIDRQIWEAADTKLRPPPLSSGGQIGGKYYSGEEVVRSKIGDSDSAIAYSGMIEDELKDKDPGLVAGHMKTIVMTDRPDQLGLYGWSGASDEWSPIQKSEHTGHDTAVHTEYGTGTRLVGNVKVTMPDGRVIPMDMDELLENEDLYKAVSDSKVKKYQV